jgi:hypothetical protein
MLLGGDVEPEERGRPVGHRSDPTCSRGATARCR